MNTPTTSIQSKRIYSCLLCMLATVILISFGFLAYFTFHFLDFAYALPLFGISLILFSVFIGWFRRTTYLKYRNNALIVKSAFNKTLLTPLRTTDLEPMVRFSKYVIVRVNFALDGIQYSYFTFTDKSNFQMIKKRQAVSRVL